MRHQYDDEPIDPLDVIRLEAREEERDALQPQLDAARAMLGALKAASKTVNTQSLLDRCNAAIAAAAAAGIGE